MVFWVTTWGQLGITLYIEHIYLYIKIKDLELLSLESPPKGQDHLDRNQLDKILTISVATKAGKWHGWLTPRAQGCPLMNSSMLKMVHPIHRLTQWSFGRVTLTKHRTGQECKPDLNPDSYIRSTQKARDEADHCLHWLVEVPVDKLTEAHGGLAWEGGG